MLRKTGELEESAEEGEAIRVRTAAGSVVMSVPRKDGPAVPTEAGFGLEDLDSLPEDGSKISDSSLGRVFL